MFIVEAAADGVRFWADRLSQTLTVRLRTTPDPRTGDFAGFLEELAARSGKIRVIHDEGETGEFPAILISPSLTYQALPLERELAPFLEILSNSVGDLEPPETALKQRLAQISWPAEVKIFIASACPHCPETVRRISPLAFQQPRIQISIVDGVLFPELSDPFGIRAVPTVILDDKFRWTGSIDTNDFLETVIHRDGALLPVSALKTLLKEGQADRLAKMMLERGEIFPAFTDLVTHPEWSVRLGAVVVVEEMAEKNPRLAGSVLPPLWERFSTVDTTVKGDILYLTGLAGSPEEWGERLRAILRSELPEDLRESAREALENWSLRDDA
jgi:glutaredoxin